MARRINLSQLRSKLRQAEAKQKRAIDDYNRKVRQHNQKVRQDQQKLKRAIDDYNRAARKHNATVRRNRHRLASAVQQLRTGGSPSWSGVRASATSLHESFERVDRVAGSRRKAADRFVGLSEREATNSAELVNALESDIGIGASEDSLRESAIEDELLSVSADLDSRWRGALFALDPRNPDAARHFCASAREIFTVMLNRYAPNDRVAAETPRCAFTEQGEPTRRAKITWLLSRKGLGEEAFAEFVEKDMGDVLGLFRTFNDGTHGSAGRFTLTQLAAIKRRVEDGILFLADLGTWD